MGRPHMHAGSQLWAALGTASPGALEVRLPSSGSSQLLTRRTEYMQTSNNIAIPSIAEHRLLYGRCMLALQKAGICRLRGVGESLQHCRLHS